MFDVRSLFAALRRPLAPTAPSGSGIAYARGVAALAGRRPHDALAAFDDALEAAKTAQARAAAHNKRGVALVALDRRAEALDAFCLALAEDERSADAVANVGTLMLEDDHPLDAIDYYEGAIRIDDRCALAYRNLGVALRRLGRRAEAVRALRKADRLGSARSRERA
jgi:tetratricopeptide (TPR) repeat protein